MLATAMVENIAEIALATDHNGRIVYANPAGCSGLGYSGEELTRESVENLFHLSGTDRKAFRECTAEGRSGSFVASALRKDGSKFPVQLSVSPIRTDATVRGMVVVAVDVSERDQARNALRASQQMLQLILDAIPVRVFWKDRQSRYLGCNRHFAKDAGLSSPEDIIGKDDFELSWSEQANLYRADDQRVMESGTPKVNYEEPQSWPDGTRLWLRTSKVPLRDLQGRVMGVLGTYEDITERKRVEDEKRGLEEKVLQAQKLESLGILAGGVAHDFNNLLMGILGHADLLLSDLPPESPLSEGLGQIAKSAMRAAEITKGLLAYSGKGRFVVEPLCLTKVVDEMSHLLGVSVAKKAFLKYELEEDLPAVEGDVSQMRQVVMNLVTNASDAIRSREGEIRIATGTLSCDEAYLRNSFLDLDLPAGEYVYLEISDNGCGMNDETRTKIFDPFFSTKFTGRGLGLAAVLGIVRGHGGAIRLDSEPEKGSTFRVLFPVCRTRITPDRKTARAEAKTFAGVTVLAVDDEDVVRSVAKTMLERSGFNVLTARDGEEAVKIFREHRSEIKTVVLDVTMPRMNGEETFRELRRIDGGVQVILTSGYDQREAVGRFMEEGLAGFIQKPYQSKALIAKIKEILAT